MYITTVKLYDKKLMLHLSKYWLHKGGIYLGVHDFLYAANTWLGFCK